MVVLMKGSKTEPFGFNEKLPFFKSMKLGSDNMMVWNCMSSMTEL